MSKFIISIVGPTAIGKTALSLDLAEYFNAPILSADSRQFYKEMRIGTAVPSTAELARAEHYFIQHTSILEPYSVGDFEHDAIGTITRLHEHQDIIIMVGGSGLYVDAVTKGLNDFPEIDPKIRLRLNDQLTNDGLNSLQEQLKQLDLEAYETLDINNPHRVIRALEVNLGTDRSFTYYKNQPKPKRAFQTLQIGLTAERAIIYDRINKRVDLMMANGLLDEVRSLTSYKHVNALNTVGYKELFKYLDGYWDLEMAVSEIKKNTRRFAKRQLTWFKKDTSTKWFDFETPVEPILEYIKGRL